MRSALEIANWLIVNRGPHQITNLKMQKLLYVVFGFHAASYDEELFYDPIEAWKYGPVVQSVYYQLNHHRRNPIETPISLPDGSVPMVFDGENEAIDSLKSVLNIIGHKSAIDLMVWSHKSGSPWDQVYNGNGSGIKKIGKDEIRDFFRSPSGSACKVIPFTRQKACFR